MLEKRVALYVVLAAGRTRKPRFFDSGRNMGTAEGFY